MGAKRMGEEGRERRSCGVWSVVCAAVWRKKRKSSSPKKMGKEKEEKSEIKDLIQEKLPQDTLVLLGGSMNIQLLLYLMLG